MRRSTLAIACALLTMLAGERVGRPEEPIAPPAPVALGDERAYAIEILAVYADAAACEARMLTKGASATYFRMKVVELDHLEYRIRNGEPVKYRDIANAIDPLAQRLNGY
jgi:hypothetical protein